MIHAATHLALILAACVEDGSTFTVVGEAPIAAPARSRIVVDVEDDRAAPDRPMPLPVRVVVTASDGSHPDGSGRGTYSDGRFFAEAGFSVDGAARAGRRSSCGAGRITSRWRRKWRRRRDARPGSGPG